MTRLRKYFWLLFFNCFVITSTIVGQESIQAQICVDEKFDRKVRQLISGTVPVISPDGLKEVKTNSVLLDAREIDEYDVSHIKGALHAGYENFLLDPFLSLPRDTTIVLYCSVGYRSEKIGEEFLKAGFTNVYNLYGSIFEWVNQDNQVVDASGIPTNEVHTYNKTWSKWLNGNKAIKIW